VRNTSHLRGGSDRVPRGTSVATNIEVVEVFGRHDTRTQTTSPWLVLLVDVLATYRLTRLVTADVISEPARRVVLAKVGARAPSDLDDPSAQEIVESMKRPPRLATLVTCRWCAGVWIAAAVTVVRARAPQLWSPLARGLALSSGAVLLARFEDG
jgi:hypothetical protein